MIRLIIFLYFLVCSFSVVAKCSERLSFEMISEHYSEGLVNNNIVLTESEIPNELLEVFEKICESGIGENIIESAIELGEKFIFIHVSELTDPDYAVAFRVGFDDMGENAIHYTTELATWKKHVLGMKPEKEGEEITSSTLGSLIFHEFGHTKIGLHSINKKVVEIFTKKKILESERVAIKYFENPFRESLQLPLRKTYFTHGDIFSFLKPNYFQRQYY